MSHRADQTALSVSHGADTKLPVFHRADKKPYQCPTERTKLLYRADKTALSVSHRADKKL